MTDQQSQYLLEPEQLQARLNEPGLRIFDTAVTLQVKEGGYQALSGQQDYEGAHVPGAAFLDLIKALSDTGSGLGFTLPAARDLAQRVGAQGIAADSPVVLYSSGHIMWATRAFWLLYSLGHERVQVLNGGLRAWKAAGLPAQSGVEQYAASEYEAKPRTNAFVDLAQMQALVAAGEQQTTCALTADVYAGTGDFHYGRRGHIPGSTHLYYDELLDDGAFPALSDLRTRLAAAQFDGAAPVVSYCGGGIAATVLSFARLLCGCGETAVYDGSMSEWVRAGEPLREGVQP
ncbi:MAG: sulfurtransferase [Pseudomonadales bacterium]